MATTVAAMVSPFGVMVLAPRAHRLRPPLLFGAERPLEEGRVTGWGFPLGPFGFTGSSAMNSAQE